MSRVLPISREDLSVSLVEKGIVRPSVFGGIDGDDQPQMLQVESYKNRGKVMGLPVDVVQNVVRDFVDDLIQRLQTYERQGEGVLVYGGGEFANVGMGIMICLDNGGFPISRVQQIFEVTDADGVFRSPVFVVTTNSGSVYAFTGHGAFLP